MNVVAGGFGMMLSLIVAIGAQNTFLLRQGIRREHVGTITVICWLSDVVLVALGVSGVGAVVERLSLAMVIIRWAGALVLFGYAASAVARAIRGERLEIDTADGRALAPAIGTCLAITWLNPHVYLDTVLMIGAVASSHDDPGRWQFGAGAVLGSLVWFMALGYGARLLRPFFRKTIAWRILDVMIALIMIWMAIRLLRG